VLLSDAFLHLAHHLADGATDPKALDPDFGRAPEPRLDTARTLAAAIDGGAVGDALAQSAPQNPEYAALLQALERLAAQKGAAARADRVRANLERWRWAPHDLGARHLRVNVASYGLQAFEDGQVRLDMRVVVGERDWRTPLVSSAVTRLVLHPDWRVPASIAVKEMLPAAQRDAGYFAAQGIQVLEGDDPNTAREVDAKGVDWGDVDAEDFPYHLRQPPGPHNPLGQIKFVFENRFGVYLHGTPADRAFTRGVRTLSHGCVRVEDEVKLAEFALAPDPSWTHERLVAELARDPETERELPLPQPLPVHLLYFTAFAGPDGQVSFGPDPYDWDPTLVAALAAAR
jgi:murein L,D-transpeptidase YcbB/YkuD